MPDVVQKYPRVWNLNDLILQKKSVNDILLHSLKEQVSGVNISRRQIMWLSIPSENL
jgi:hypothetical protein